MFIHYIIILYGAILVFASTNGCSRLVLIFKSIQSKHKFSFNTYRKNPTIEIKLIQNKTTDLSNSSSANLTNARVRREFLRENTINDRDNVNIYGDEDGRYFRNQAEEIVEPKRIFDGEYYLPMKNQFRISKCSFQKSSLKLFLIQEI